MGMIAGGQEGWRIIADWEYQGLGLLDIPSALLDAFKGHHRGYYYMLAVYFTFLRIPSQLSAAALSCCAGAMTAVFAYRLARSIASDWVAWRVGWWTCLFPIMIIWSAQTIKEPFVILLEVLALYGCIQLRISKFALRHILLCGACVIIVASMRFYAAYITGLVILITLALPHLRRRKFSAGAAIGVVAIAIPVLYSVGALNKDTETAGEFDLQRVDQFRQGMAKGADSGVETNFDTQTTRGLGLMTLVGEVHLLLAPFPWQLRAGSVRMALTAPEMVVWWYSVFRPGVARVEARDPASVRRCHAAALVPLAAQRGLQRDLRQCRHRIPPARAVDALPLDLRGDRAGAAEAAPDVAGEPGSRINRDRGGP